MTTGVTAARAPVSEEPREVRLEPVYVWDLVVRSTHWLIALSLILLSVTGVYIGHPFLTSSGQRRIAS
jgi:Ni,Fe-hydrogenase I cytochrome b subunit